MDPVRSTVALLVVGLVLTAGPPAHAHPLGLASVNRYVGIRPGATYLEVDYLLDLAELPAWAEIEALDADHDGGITLAERDAWVATLLPRIALRVGTSTGPVVLHPTGWSVEAPPGQNGLSTLRVAVSYTGVLPAFTPGALLRVTVTDTTWSDRPGWREIDPDPSHGFTVVSSTLSPALPRAGATLAYPMTRAALPREDTAVLVFRPSTTPVPGTSHPAPQRHGGSVSTGTPDGPRLVALLRTPVDRATPGVLLFALGLAFALGAGHALEPGHGKALTAAWLVGSRARIRDAVALGLVVTVTHTATVFALGLTALTLERTVGSARLFRALEVTSGLLVLGMALRSVPARWRQVHPHPHPHGPSLTHGETDPPAGSTWRAWLAVGVSGGVVPCPGALVVLLAAIGMHRLAWGMALLGAFSAGLASVLTAVGVVAVLARQRLATAVGDARWVRALPRVSGVAVAVLGVVLVVRGLAGR